MKIWEDFMLNWFRSESKILLVSLVIGVLFAVGVASYTFVYSMTVQREIADSVLRFHVMAHSDCEDEQLLKENVRMGILEEFAGTLATHTDIYETREMLFAMLPELKKHAEEVVRRAGFEHDVTAEITNVFFPTQLYGNIAFPPGIYEAVQISIGDGKGQNWWCLMFPPLCYVDMTATDEGRRLLAETVSEEGFRLLIHREEESPELIVRFRVVEWWQNIRQPLTPPQSPEQPPTYQVAKGIAEQAEQTPP
jgi:stage II sporulation protein R